MNVTAKATRKVIRKRVVCGVNGCSTTIGHHVFKEGLKKYADGFVWEPTNQFGGTKSLRRICVRHADAEARVQ